MAFGYRTGSERSAGPVEFTVSPGFICRGSIDRHLDKLVASWRRDKSARPFGPLLSRPRPSLSVTAPRFWFTVLS